MCQQLCEIACILVSPVCVRLRVRVCSSIYLWCDLISLWHGLNFPLSSTRKPLLSSLAPLIESGADQNLSTLKRGADSSLGSPHNRTQTHSHYRSGIYTHEWERADRTHTHKPQKMVLWPNTFNTMTCSSRVWEMRKTSSTVMGSWWCPNVCNATAVPVFTVAGHALHIRLRPTNSTPSLEVVIISTRKGFV